MKILKLWTFLLITSKLINLIFTQTDTSTDTSTDTDTDNSTCYLTGIKNNNPFPSLIKCYKYNQDTCCTSVHDDYISDFISSLLTSSCARKYYELEDLFCYGCNPSEYYYSDREKKEISMCLTFALNLWNATSIEELNQPTTRFDNCGFKVNDSSPPGLKGLTDKPYLIPSKAFGNFTDFITKIGIPFYDDYKIVLIDDTNSTDTNKIICFGSSKFIAVELIWYFTFVLLILFI